MVFSIFPLGSVVYSLKKRLDFSLDKFRIIFVCFFPELESGGFL